jgi:methylamine dehydrogenase accessory protein MauD
MMTALIISEVLQWIVLAALAVAGLALARQVGVLHVRVAPAGALDAGKGPAVGEQAPHLHVTTLDGKAMTIGKADASTSLRLLMFVSAQCPLCKSLIPVAKSFAAAERVDLVFIGDDDPAAQRAMIAKHDMAGYPFINSPEVGMAFEVAKLPHAVLLDAGGKVLAKGLVNSREHLESLIVSHEMGVPHVQDYIAGLNAPVAKAEAA